MRGYVRTHEMQEISNKLEAFRLFAYADRELDFSGADQPLPELVRLAGALPPLQRSFAVEGVAHYYVNHLSSDSAETGLLADPGLPETAMVPLHAGMGISFALSALAGLGGMPSEDELRDALGRFMERCRAQSRPGWHESAAEAMGLAVRTMHPHLISAVSEALGAISRPAQRLFWHGVGRSLYFIPNNFLSFGESHERAVRAAVAEAPSPEDRCNAVAGLVWAVTLVNIEYPAIVESLLRKVGPFGMPEAFTNGVISALMAWKHMVPDGNEVLAPYLRSASPGGMHMGRWNDLIAKPANQAFAETFPVLTGPWVPGQPTIANLFQFHHTIVPGARAVAGEAER